MKKTDRAEGLIEEGNYIEAHGILMTLIETEDPEALYLYSSFGVDDSESIEQFENRSLQLIRRAAELGLPDALYTLGVIYESGDGNKGDIEMASSLYMEAAKRGHPRAKFSYGLDLYYGSNGIPMKQEEGKKLIGEAANEEVEGASEILEKIRDDERSGTT